LHIQVTNLMVRSFSITAHPTRQATQVFAHQRMPEGRFRKRQPRHRCDHSPGLPTQRLTAALKRAPCTKPSPLRHGSGMIAETTPDRCPIDKKKSHGAPWLSTAVASHAGVALPAADALSIQRLIRFASPIRVCLPDESSSTITTGRSATRACMTRHLPAS
jgi:hypothetical protein